MYAGGTSGIATFPIQNCESYLLCEKCIKLKDPYCAWSTSNGKCMQVKHLTPSDRLQDLLNGDESMCPKGMSYSAELCYN